MSPRMNALLLRGRLRTLIARMVVDRPEVTNREIAHVFGKATGARIAFWTVRDHRYRMGLPSAPVGRRWRS